MSIIVTCREQQPELMRLLPELLSVQYSGDCEVIVVDEIHDRDMEKWLEEMEQHYPQLCHTFCSATARGINIRRLALTLGAKASSSEWLAILSADTVLPGADWLYSLTSCCKGDIDMVKGTKGRWPWFTFRNLFRRHVSLFSPTTSILLCRRSKVLESGSGLVPKKRVARVSL